MIPLTERKIFFGECRKRRRITLLKSLEVIKGVKSERCVRMNIVSCPPVVTVIIKRPDLRHQLGFSVQVIFRIPQLFIE